MSSYIVRVLLWGVILILLSGNVFAEEHWVYRYDGPASGVDLANSVAVGADGNIYAGGQSEGEASFSGFTVVSLTESGTERWVYRFDGSALYDQASDVTVGSDGNVYAAGYSEAAGARYDFFVVSLTALGGERWVYGLDGPGNDYDAAYAVTMGLDGNIYAAGYCVGSVTSSDFTVVSLTASGVERWVYTYDGPGSGWDAAYSIVMGPDSNLYVSGASSGSGTHYDFTVVSLTASGVERWVYRYDGPGSAKDEGYSIAAGSDGNLYAAGPSDGGATDQDFLVVSLTASGLERWIYRYNGAADTMMDVAHSIAVGSDDNLYVTGYSCGTGMYDDFTVVSLTDSGVERWVYEYDGPASANDRSYSIAAGSDGNLYVAGMSDGGGTSYDFAVISLTASGSERWIYRYNGPANSDDGGTAIVMGSDGNLYAAGSSAGDGTGSDFIVLSLGPEMGVEEGLNRASVPDFRLCQNSPNPFDRSSSIQYSLPQASEVTISIYDITGRLVETLVDETNGPGIHQVRWDRKANPSGVYFYCLRTGEFVETRKMVLLD